jgi:hypothetical protein
VGDSIQHKCQPQNRRIQKPSLVIIHSANVHDPRQQGYGCPDLLRIRLRLDPTLDADPAITIAAIFAAAPLDGERWSGAALAAITALAPIIWDAPLVVTEPAL